MGEKTGGIRFYSDVQLPDKSPGQSFTIDKENTNER
jgi:hypothetical protein